jgi:chorismate dehydratase
VSNAKRLGVVDALYCQPLFYDLAGVKGFVPVTDVPARNALHLRARELDAAFLTPIDYARESSDYRIVPGIGVASQQGSGTVCIFFKDNLHTISSVAIDPSSISEIVLSRIILAEEFDLNPSFIPAQGTLDELLHKADAAVLSGDACLTVAEAHPNQLDLVEAWNDLTGLPYVHGFWCGREGALDQQDVERLQASVEHNLSSPNDFARVLHAHARSASFPLAFYRSYLDAFSYQLTEEDIAGLGEFIRYAYYHSVLPDVAEINFYRFDEDSPSNDLSHN